MASATIYQDLEFPKNIFASVGGKRLNPNADGSFFDCLQSLIAGVVFSYTAVEAFANSTIPDDFLFSIERDDKKCRETYSKDQIERHMSLDKKLDKVLPQVCSLTSPKGTKLWVQYNELKKMRDRLIHLKSADWEPSPPERAEDYVWTLLLAADTRQRVGYAFEIIWYFLPSEKPRWAVKFRGA